MFRKQRYTLKFFEEIKVEKLFELPGAMSVEEGRINNVWKQYDVHVYAIEDVKSL